MFASLRALLEGVVDYAGLFPPAQLPLDTAFRNYIRYRSEPESWMLGRFIIPAAKLIDLAPLLKQLPPSAAPIPLSVLGRGGPTPEEFAAGRRDDLKAISSFERENGTRFSLEAFEVRLAPRVIDTMPTAPDVNMLSIWSELSDAELFFEVALDGDWRNALRQSLALILGPAAEGFKTIRAGIKLRCGGLEAAAFPSSQQIAAVVVACRDALVPLKFTAGLHHPLRHYNERVKTHMHGFLNVFIAGVLAHRFHLTEGQVQELLEDEDPAHFRFDDEGLRWRDYRASLGEIRLARQLAVTSFGSCSFDEPREDLRRLRLLER